MKSTIDKMRDAIRLYLQFTKLPKGDITFFLDEKFIVETGLSIHFVEDTLNVLRDSGEVLSFAAGQEWYEDCIFHSVDYPNGKDMVAMIQLTPEQASHLSRSDIWVDPIDNLSGFVVHEGRRIKFSGLVFAVLSLLYTRYTRGAGSAGSASLADEINEQGAHGKSVTSKMVTRSIREANERIQEKLGIQLISREKTTDKQSYLFHWSD